MSDSNLVTTLRGTAAGLLAGGERRAAKACSDAASRITLLEAEKEQGFLPEWLKQLADECPPEDIEALNALLDKLRRDKMSITNGIHPSMQNEFYESAAEKEECRVIDAVLAKLPNADINLISDLMTGGLSVKEIVAEIIATRG